MPGSGLIVQGQKMNKTCLDFWGLKFSGLTLALEQTQKAFRQKTGISQMCPEVCLSHQMSWREPTFKKRPSSLPHTMQPVKVHSFILLLLHKIWVFPSVSSYKTLNSLQPTFHGMFGIREQYFMENFLKTWE